MQFAAAGCEMNESLNILCEVTSLTAWR